MTATTGRLRSIASKLSPRARRYRSFLQQLPLDPDLLPESLPEPGPGNFVMCGCPRTGTTLLSAALFQPPRCITVMEPWDALKLLPADLFASLRSEIDEGSLHRGRLDHEALGRDGRVSWVSDRSVNTPVQAEADYLLGVKWTGWWRFIDSMPQTPFLVCLREPAEVVASMRDAGGRVGEGLQYDTPFNRAMNEHLLAATDDPALRRILLFDYIHERLAPLLDRPNVMVVRYERWAGDAPALLRDVSDFLGRQLDETRVNVRPAQPLRMTDDEQRLVRTNCRTAALIGYA